MKKRTVSISSLTYLKFGGLNSGSKISQVKTHSTQSIWPEIGIDLAAVTLIMIFCVVIILDSNKMHALGNKFSIDTSGQSLANSPVIGNSPLVILSDADAKTAAWYVSHPAILKQYERSCTKAAGTMLYAPCENVYSADRQINLRPRQ